MASTIILPKSEVNFIQGTFSDIEKEMKKDLPQVSKVAKLLKVKMQERDFDEVFSIMAHGYGKKLGKENQLIVRAFAQLLNKRKRELIHRPALTI